MLKLLCNVLTEECISAIDKQGVTEKILNAIFIKIVSAR